MSWGVDCFVQGSCECRLDSTSPVLYSRAGASLSTVKISKEKTKQMQNNSHCLLKGVSPLFLLEEGLNTLLPLISGRGSTVHPTSFFPNHLMGSLLSLCPILINTSVPLIAYSGPLCVCRCVCVCECAECGQKTSGSVTLRSSHCWERVCVQSLTLGTWLSSSLALSRHWLLLTWTRVSFCTAEKHRQHVCVRRCKPGFWLVYLNLCGSSDFLFLSFFSAILTFTYFNCQCES